MPSDSPSAGTPAWRKDVKPTGRDQKAQPEWRREPSAPTSPKGSWNRQIRLGLGTAGLVGTVVALVWVIYWYWPVRPACLVLEGAHYLPDDQHRATLGIPHNAYGWKGLQSLADLSNLVPLLSSPEECRTTSDWYKRAAQRSEEAIIVFLALHGGADSNGPYLLPQDTDPWDEKTRLYISKLLDQLDELQQRKKVLLLLDATQVPANGLLGMLHNDFARAMQDEKIKGRIKKLENLLVLCSSGPDQRSWVSEEYQQTIFTHFVLEGLRGAADLKEADGTGGNGNDRVTAQALASYVTRNVKKWVAETRDALQEPFFLGDEDKAKKMILCQVRQPYVPSDSKQDPGYPPLDSKRLDGLRNLWEERERLASSVPAPYVYTPQLWRQYQETLLLYEQLLRAGSDRAPEIEKALSSLKGEMSRAEGIKDLFSVQNTVAMPAALGVQPAWENRLAEEKREELWHTSMEERATKWAQWLKETPDKERLLRVQMSGLLVERAALEGTRKALKEANDLLHSIGATDTDRPTEAQFLAIANRDLPARLPPEETLRLAFRVSRLAQNTALAIPEKEKQHPYSEFVFPWTRQKIDRADDWRRSGEDLLLATNPEDWKRARELLGQAERKSTDEGYQSARQDAEEVRAAFDTCQKVMSSLPYYTECLARQANPEMELCWDRAKELWQETHLLAQALEELEPKPEWIRQPRQFGGDDLRPKSLSDRRRSVHNAFDQVQDEFRSYCERLSKNRNRVMALRQIEEVLSVPELPVPTRMSLLETVKIVSQNLHEKAADPTRLTANPPDAALEQKHAQAHARREGLAWLWALGKRWFNEREIGSDRTFDNVSRELNDPPKEENWSRPFLGLGAEVGKRWLRLPGAIEQRVEEARKAPKFDQAAPLLVGAERLARQLDGASARRLTRNPVQQARALRLYNLFLWQAERALQDHWFSEEKNAERQYYQNVGNYYVEDAQGLLKSISDEATVAERSETLRKWGASRFEKVSKLELESADDRSLDITSEKEVNLRYRLVPKGDWVPEGKPVVWMEKLEKTLALKGNGGRVVTPTDGKKTADLPRFVFDRQEDKSFGVRPERLQANLQGRFRGQVIARPTTLNVYHVPDIIRAEDFTMHSSGVAVRAAQPILDEFAPRNAALAIVLDASGSMKDKADGTRPFADGTLRSDGTLHLNANGKKDLFTKETDCKWWDAIRALKQMLTELDDEVWLSITVFSHLKKGQYDEHGNPLDRTLRQQPSEDTIEQIRKPRRWNKGELNALIKQLEDLCPFNSTPLVKSIYEAKEKGFPTDKQFKGRKTILVLTDGEDNRFFNPNPDPYYKHVDELHQKFEVVKNAGTKKKIPSFLMEEFKDSDIQLNLLGFGVTESEKAGFKEQFEEVVTKLKPPGNCKLVGNTKELTLELRKRMRQKLLFKIQPLEGNRPGERSLKDMPPDGWEITQENSSSPLPLSPGAYRLLVQLKEPLQQIVRLNQGEYLLVGIRPDGLAFERVLAGNHSRLQDFGKSYQPKEDLLLAVPQVQLMPDQSLEMMVTLEYTKDRMVPNGYLEQVKPRMVWFDVVPKGVPHLQSLSWVNLHEYECPLWRLKATPWPSATGATPVPPQISVSWNWPRDKATFVIEEVRREKGTFDTFYQSKREIPYGGDKIRIESVSVEDQRLSTVDPQKGPVPCLVVRVSFPKKPQPQLIWVEPGGVTYEVAEHRFYSEAGKYMGVFGPLNQERAADLDKLALYSVDEFKRQAESWQGILDAPNNQPGPESHGKLAATLRK